MITYEQYIFLKGEWPMPPQDHVALCLVWDEVLDLGYFTFEGKLTPTGEEAVRSYSNDND
jgi:hypothetical protein